MNQLPQEIHTDELDTDQEKDQLQKDAEKIHRYALSHPCLTDADIARSATDTNQAILESVNNIYSLSVIAVVSAKEKCWQINATIRLSGSLKAVSYDLLSRKHKNLLRAALKIIAGDCGDKSSEQILETPRGLHLRRELTTKEVVFMFEQSPDAKNLHEPKREETQI